MTAITIEDAVRRAAAYLQQDELAVERLRPTLDLDPAAEPEEVATVAALLLCNAALMHKRLKSDAKGMSTLAGLDYVARASVPTELLISQWVEILKQDFAPIFRPALAVLQSLPPSEPVKFAVVTIVECANQLADEVSDLGYDHAGPLYHRILGSAVSDGAFYTKHISALMLAGLTLSQDMIDWSDIEAVKRLKVLDPACGTGTLLMAALKVIKDRALEAGACKEEDLPELHRHLVQNGIRGLDINYQATQLAASSLTLGAPSVDYQAMHIHTMQHGPQPDGSVRLGSLELLADAVKGEQPDLFANAKHAPLAHEVEAKRVKEDLDVHDADVVIMNPPFTNNTKFAKWFGNAAARKMQERRIQLSRNVEMADQDAGGVIDSNGMSTFFTPLAEALTKRSSAAMGQVLPATVCTGESALEQRKFLADRFHVESVITSHDPTSINFSENTGIHESLIVCRRRDDTEGRPTRFISLRQMPQDADEIAQCLADLATETRSDWHQSYEWPRERVTAGDWTPAQYYDAELAEVVLSVRCNSGLKSAARLARIGPASRRVQDAFVNPTNIVTNGGGGTTYSVIWSHRTGVRQRMLADPEFRTQPKSDKLRYATRTLWPMASQLLIAQRIDTTNVKTPAIFASEPCLGGAWTPVSPLNHAESTIDIQKSWCAYLNSICGTLFLLNIRARKLTYPQYSLDLLRSIPLPDPSLCDLTPLVRAFDDLCESELLPWAQMDVDPVRHKIDAAVAEVLDLNLAEMADWRRRIVNEPTVSNRPAE